MEPIRFSVIPFPDECRVCQARNGRELGPWLDKANPSAFGPLTAGGEERMPTRPEPERKSIRWRDRRD
ncbi:hypothetical protein [Methylacidimicrobium sp. AP8]|uniref:hypothetical protein n=1 Tax=Methylacidimicrobium sp. AP8 TaxID=2730359 RepID=UPI001924C281|nr:hypothetical protein [Methylacidimicrobium sp. AP8]